MTHIRWTQQSGKFPTNKYHFSDHLKSIGDFVTTHPIDMKDYKRFSDAAYLWAWYKGWKVSVKRVKVAHGMYEVTCTLVKKKFERLYE